MPAAQSRPILQFLRRLVGQSLSPEGSDRFLVERFIASKDEAAFAVLFERHSALVFSVCRSVLRNEHDAEDALQATFLILARQASTIRKRDSIASWLHGVAFRTAMKLRRSQAARRRREQAEHPSVMAQPVLEAALHEIQTILHEEIERLPAKLSLPFVICCLQGKSRTEAASELGWKEGTVAGRVAQARSLLETRLKRRGVALTAALTALAVSPGGVSALSASIIRNAVAYGSGSSCSPMSNQAVQLAEGMVRSMVVAKAKAIGVFAAMAMFLLVGTGLLAHSCWPDDSPPPQQQELIAKAANPVEDKKVLPNAKSDNPTTMLNEPVNRPPLELRLVPKRTNYPSLKAGESPNFVAIEFQLTNVSQQKLDLFLAPEPVLELTGPRTESVRKSGSGMFYVAQESHRTLDPGESYRITLRKLEYRVGASQFRVAWLEPGVYTLQAAYRISVSPPPPDSEAGKIDMFRQDGISPDKKFGTIVIKSNRQELLMREGSVMDEWTKALRDDNIDVRRIAVQNLAELGPAAVDAGEALVSVLDEVDAELRVSAMQTLAGFGPKVKATAFARLLPMVNDSNKKVRIGAITALSQIAATEKDVAKALRLALKDRDHEIRLAVAAAWKAIPRNGHKVEPADTESLLSALNTETADACRRELIHALAEHPQLDVLNAILPYLKARDIHTRYAAFATAGHLGVFCPRDAAKEKQLGDPIRKAVASLIDAMSDAEAMPYALHALRQFRADAAPAVPVLLTALDDPRNQHKDSIHHPRVLLVQAFRDIGPGAKAAVKTLANRLVTDPDWSVRQYCVQALAAIGPDAMPAAPSLVSAFKDAMVQVRQEVAPALVKIGAIDALLDGLREENHETRRGVISALGTMPKHATTIVPVLVKQMRDDANIGNRGVAAYALGSFDTTDGVRALAEALKDNHVRVHALGALRQLGVKAAPAAPVLFDVMTTDKSDANREQAGWTLCSTNVKGKKEYVPGLIAILSENDKVALPAIYLLGQIGPEAKAAVPAIRRFTSSPSVQHMQAAKGALQAIGE